MGTLRRPATRCSQKSLLANCSIARSNRGGCSRGRASKTTGIGIAMKKMMRKITIFMRGRGDVVAMEVAVVEVESKAATGSGALRNPGNRRNKEREEWIKRLWASS